MNESGPPDPPPMSPRLARILPLAGTAIIPVVAFAVGLAYGPPPRYAATAGIIFAATTLASWGVLLLFGRPVQGEETFWVMTPGFMLTLLTPRVSLIPYATIFIHSFLLSVFMAVLRGTIGRALNRQSHGYLDRPRRRAGATGGDREPAASQGDDQP